MPPVMVGLCLGPGELETVYSICLIIVSVWVTLCVKLFNDVDNVPSAVVRLEIICCLNRSKFDWAPVTCVTMFTNASSIFVVASLTLCNVLASPSSCPSAFDIAATA